MIASDAKTLASQLSRKLSPTNPKIVLSGVDLLADEALQELMGEMQQINRCPVYIYAHRSMRQVLDANNASRFVIFLVGAGLNAQSRSELNALPSNGHRLKVVLVQFA
jgi:hypothetical protein